MASSFASVRVWSCREWPGLCVVMWSDIIDHRLQNSPRLPYFPRQLQLCSDPAHQHLICSWLRRLIALALGQTRLALTSTGFQLELLPIIDCRPRACRRARLRPTPSSRFRNDRDPAQSSALPRRNTLPFASARLSLIPEAQLLESYLLCRRPQSYCRPATLESIPRRPPPDLRHQFTSPFSP